MEANQRRLSLVAIATVLLTIFSNFNAVKGEEDDDNCDFTFMTCKGRSTDVKLLVGYMMRAKSPILPLTEDVKLVCDDVRRIKSCLSAASITCEDYLDGALSRFLNAYSYLCEELPLSAYRYSYDCLMNSTVRGVCYASALTCDNIEDKCKMSTIAHECLRKSLSQNCGQGATKHFIEFSNRLVKNPCNVRSARSDGVLWLPN